MLGWKELVIKTQQNYPNSFILSANGYKTTICMPFLAKKIYAPNIIGNHTIPFDYIGDNLLILKRKTSLFIDSDKRFKNNLKKGDYPIQLDSYFTDIKELEPIIIYRNGKNTREFRIYACSNYTPTKKEQLNN